jgi:hypothetical protein
MVLQNPYNNGVRSILFIFGTIKRNYFYCLELIFAQTIGAFHDNSLA